MSTEYNFSILHIRDLKMHCFSVRLSMPELFRFATLEDLQSCYNGIGPDRWSSRFRRFTTWVLTFLEAPALIHDWEYTYQPKTYGYFTLANLRLAYNAAKDKHPFSGITAAVLCQCFGWRGFPGADSLPPSKPRLSGTVSKRSLLRFVPKYAICLPVLLLAGCFSPTKSTITEYDANGHIIRQAVTSESVVKTVVESTKDKSVVVWDNSWLAYMTVTTSTVEDPTPTMRMGVGRADKGAATIHKDHDLTLLPAVIEAVRAGEITVSVSGIGSRNDKTAQPADK